MGDETTTTGPARDPEHWLHRFTAQEWLAAATHELHLTVEALGARRQKQGVVLARRAAGMALNAVLTAHPDEAWGRSYVEHLRAVAVDERVEEIVRQACAQLLDAPIDAPRFVRIGGGGEQGLGSAAATIIEWSRTRVQDAPPAPAIH